MSASTGQRDGNLEPLGNTTANNLCKWFHGREDELNHRRQIMWLKRRLPPG
jgi:hypothetical protein